MILLLLLYGLPYLLLTLLVEVEFFGWATISLLVASAVMGWLHWSEIIPYVKDHAAIVGLYAGIYIVAGVAWSFIKWLLFLVKFNSGFKEARTAFLRARELPNTTLPVNLAEDFRSWCRSYYPKLGITSTKGSGVQKLERPQAIDNKKRIIAWGSFWPCSILGFVLNDPVRAIFTHLFNLFSGSYQWMSNKIVSQDEFSERPIPAPPMARTEGSVDTDI